LVRELEPLALASKVSVVEESVDSSEEDYLSVPHIKDLICTNWGQVKSRLVEVRAFNEQKNANQAQTPDSMCTPSPESMDDGPPNSTDQIGN